ncbi:hypothetical protein [Mesorhizobium sp. B4-1-1]|uniref:hypothetical protein n=1 Tax=Mesorhizobium sp. B4-1-1 TaxID=2589890 RepID=UPI001125F15C|nr:hypothetical protein [Mesorhizobium sp. B4-1-1]TPI18271.1 hypothetical protein FJW10_18745 [Mesorhizobium sp. B4-1-1]
MTEAILRNISLYFFGFVATDRPSTTWKRSGISCAWIPPLGAAQNAQAKLDAANAQLAADQSKLTGLTQQLADLNAIATTGFTPEQQAALDAQIAHVQAQIDAQNTAITADNQSATDAPGRIWKRTASHRCIFGRRPCRHGQQGGRRGRDGCGEGHAGEQDRRAGRCHGDDDGHDPIRVPP